MGARYIYDECGWKKKEAGQYAACKELSRVCVVATLVN